MARMLQSAADDEDERSPIPQDPMMMVGGATVGQTSDDWQAQHQAAFNEMCQNLDFTLNSKTRFTLNELKSCFMEDFYPNTSLDALAKGFGFTNFEAMLKKPHLEEVVLVETSTDNDNVYYRAHPQDLYKEIRQEMDQVWYREQDNFNTSIYLRNKKQEELKRMRANLPENKGKLLEGRKLLVRLVHEISSQQPGGELVMWDAVQKRYQAEFGQPFVGDELRKYFQRDTPIKIIENYCDSELEAFYHEKYNGRLLVRLRKPYEEILQGFDDLAQKQEEAAKREKAAARDFQSYRRNPHTDQGGVKNQQLEQLHRRMQQPEYQQRGGGHKKVRADCMAASAPGVHPNVPTLQLERFARTGGYDTGQRGFHDPAEEDYEEMRDKFRVTPANNNDNNNATTGSSGDNNDDETTLRAQQALGDVHRQHRSSAAAGSTPPQLRPPLPGQHLGGVRSRVLMKMMEEKKEKTAAAGEEAARGGERRVASSESEPARTQQGRKQRGAKNSSRPFSSSDDLSEEDEESGRRRGPPAAAALKAHSLFRHRQAAKSGEREASPSSGNESSSQERAVGEQIKRAPLVRVAKPKQMVIAEEKGELHFENNSGGVQAKRNEKYSAIEKSNEDVEDSTGLERAVPTSSSKVMTPMVIPKQVLSAEGQGEEKKMLLEYIYKDRDAIIAQGEGHHWQTTEVLRLVDKYALRGLKAQQQGRLAARDITSMAQLVEMALLADQLQCPALMKACSDYLTTNRRRVLGSSEWKELKATNSRLACDLLEMNDEE